MRLATDLADPAERIKAIYANSQGAKEMAKALTAHQIMGLTETTPPGLLSLAARAYTASGIGRTLAPINVVISNVPGRTSRCICRGAVVERLSTGGPAGSRCRTEHHLLQLRGSVDFGFVTTPEIANDIDALADAIEPALD